MPASLRPPLPSEDQKSPKKKQVRLNAHQEVSGDLTMPMQRAKSARKMRAPMAPDPYFMNVCKFNLNYPKYILGRFMNN